MVIKLANTNKEFKIDYQYLFDKYELELQLFYINIFNGDQVIGLSNSRGGVYNDDKLSLLFLDANPFNLQLFGINNSLEISECLVEYIKSNNINIRGILGNKKDTDLFIKAFGNCFNLDIAMDIMKLTSLKLLARRGE